MTYKNAAAGLNLGGGKAVIIGDARTDKNEEMFRAFGRYIEGLAGRYITAEDVGTTEHDMDIIHEETNFVTGISLSAASGCRTAVSATEAPATRASGRPRRGRRLRYHRRHSDRPHGPQSRSEGAAATAINDEANRARLLPNSSAAGLEPSSRRRGIRYLRLFCVECRSQKRSKMAHGQGRVQVDFGRAAKH